MTRWPTGVAVIFFTKSSPAATGSPFQATMTSPGRKSARAAGLFPATAWTYTPSRSPAARTRSWFSPGSAGGCTAMEPAGGGAILSGEIDHARVIREKAVEPGFPGGGRTGAQRVALRSRKAAKRRRFHRKAGRVGEHVPRPLHGGRREIQQPGGVAVLRSALLRCRENFQAARVAILVPGVIG